uniref:Putative OTU family cysteine protease n=1 Tax=Toxoplasma gondii COUG TaxID=1074873 RepID=A0A2G8XTY3_TOXGO|nr:putative OTU family cysteine protease [Toxoplasma gondii COUG]
MRIKGTFARRRLRQARTSARSVIGLLTTQQLFRRCGAVSTTKRLFYNQRVPPSPPSRVKAQAMKARPNVCPCCSPENRWSIPPRSVESTKRGTPYGDGEPVQSAGEADDEEDAWSETGSEGDADGPPRNGKVLTQADEDGQSFEGDLTSANRVASTQAVEDFSGDEWEIPEETSPAERMSARTPTPPGGAPGDCCRDGNEEKIFGRFAALHAKEQAVC